MWKKTHNINTTVRFLKIIWLDAGSDIKKPTQILSTLFPQTAPVSSDEKAREEKKKEEDDEKQEREKSWKTMKLW